MGVKNNMVKMIVVDLDGTILTDSGKVSKNTKEYLRRLKQNDYILTIATGRIFASALEVTRDLLSQILLYQIQALVLVK